MKQKCANRLFWLLILGTLVLSFSSVGCTVFGIRTFEEAPYEVLNMDGQVELRRYDGLVVAETVAEGDYDSSSSVAFRRLFRYISGDNQTSEEIEMTAPVVQEKDSKKISEKIAMTAPVFQEKEEGKWKMAFVLPAKYSLATAPAPTNPEVVLRQIPPRKVAAIRYSGSLTAASVLEHSRRLEQWIAENDYKPTSDPQSAGYDPPWTIPFLRRNEVLIEIQ